MMINDKLTLWLVFVFIGAMTWLPKSSLIVAGKRVQLPPLLRKFLHYTPAAALAALIAPDVFTVSDKFDVLNPKFFSAMVVVLAVQFSKNIWLPFIAGMGVLFMWNLPQ